MDNPKKAHFYYLKEVPFEIWKEIFQRFRFYDISDIKKNKQTLKNLRLVCKRFRNLVSSYWTQHVKISQLEDYVSKCEKFGFSNYSLLIISYKYSDQDKAICIPSKFKTVFSDLQSLTTHYHIRDEDLKHLPDQLISLSLEFCPFITDEALPLLSSSLQSLSLFKNSNITDKNLKYLPKSLRVLDLGGSSITDEGLKQIGTLGALTNLNLSNCMMIRGSGFHLLPINLQVEVDMSKTLPFLAATYFENLNSMKEFIKRPGFNINQSDEYGETALHFACKRKNLSIIRFLIENGADLYYSNSSGQLPLDIAINCGLNQLSIICTPILKEMRMYNIKPYFRLN